MNDSHSEIAARSRSMTLDVSFVSAICPVSKSLDTQLLCQVNGFDIYRCLESATDFVWPMPDENTLKEFYNREAWFQSGEPGGYANYDAQTEPSLQGMSELLDRFTNRNDDLSVLDVGCGYGSHLNLAAAKGWKCFGIEPSSHARDVAMQRCGEAITVVERAEDLLPMRFDLIVMFDVIEHLRDPYALFFTLFSKKAIGPETIVVITTPNARSYEAMSEPAKWIYRHPPSHLVFYSAKSFEILLRRLLFKDLSFRGAVPSSAQISEKFQDEPTSINDSLNGFSGLVVEATGSDFKEFMHERYVPGAYWKLTEYEHFPRYGLAKTMAQNAIVLDFGCGTGYGSALLSEVAHSVTGLDISAQAIDWARQTHRYKNIRFERRDDLGQGLAQGSFDLITCFEMIEHVDHELQRAAIRSIASLLKPQGKLIISTPDPRFTEPYGPNPYHLREMTESEFLELLSERFKHVKILKQWVRPSVFIGLDSIPQTNDVLFSPLTKDPADDLAVGFVAICSNQEFDTPAQFCQFDTSADFNRLALDAEHKVNRLQFDNFNLLNWKRWLDSQRLAWEKTAITHEGTIAALQEDIQRLTASNDWLASQRLAWEQAASLQGESIKNLEASKNWFAAQRDAWQNTSLLQGESIKTLEQKTIDLFNERNWIASERDAWKNDAENKAKVVDELLACVQKIRAHKGLRFINFFLRKKLL